MHGTLAATRRRLCGAGRSGVRRLAPPAASRRARPMRRRRCLRVRWPRARGGKYGRADPGPTAALIGVRLCGRVCVTTCGTARCGAATGRRRGGPYPSDGWRAGGKRGGRRTGARTGEATRRTAMATAAAAAAARGAWRAAQQSAIGAAMGWREIGEVAGGGGRSREMHLSARSWRLSPPHAAPPAACTRRRHRTSSLALTSPVAKARRLG